MSTGQYTANPSGIRLQEILPNAKLVGCNNVVIRSCCGQWDECQPDDLYVAVVGNDIDGHDFAADAIKKGATAVVGERLLAVDRPQFIVKDSRKAYGKICHALAGNPSRHLTAIGVSGTDGKTVTSHLIHSILNQSGAKAGISSTIETRLGTLLTNKLAIEKPAAISNAPALAEHMTRMVMGGCSHAVIEAGAVELAQYAFSGIELDVAVLTNIRHHNMGFHGSNENYRRSMTRLLSYVKSTGFAVLNADDPTTHSLLDQISTPALTIGIHQAAEIQATLLDRDQSGQTFFLSAGGESIPIRTNILGKQHVYNCLSAAAVAITMGIELTTIARGLETAVIPGRLERIDCGQSYGVWVDSAHSPSQIATAIAAIGRATKGRVWCVCSTDERQNTRDRKQIGHVLEKSCDHQIITSSQSSAHIDYEPTHQILDGFSNPKKAQVIPNRFRAIEYVLSEAKPDDAVLIAGCGDRTVAVVGKQAWPLTDRDICQAWLYDHASIDNSDDSDPPIFRIDDYRD